MTTSPNAAIGNLLALDPSVNFPGVALFSNGVLVAADRACVDKSWAKLDRGERARRVARSARSWAWSYVGRIDHLTYEFAQWYAREKSKGDPNDLAGLICVGAELSGQLGDHHSLATPTPAEWVGQLPKHKSGDPWASPRGVRVRSRLSVEEVARIVPSHDAIDAVGLGLFRLDRFALQRVFRGAT